MQNKYAMYSTVYESLHCALGFKWLDVLAKTNISVGSFCVNIQHICIEAFSCQNNEFVFTQNYIMYSSKPSNETNADEISSKLLTP